MHAAAASKSGLSRGVRPYEFAGRRRSVVRVRVGLSRVVLLALVCALTATGCASAFTKYKAERPFINHSAALATAQLLEYLDDGSCVSSLTYRDGTKGPETHYDPSWCKHASKIEAQAAMSLATQPPPQVAPASPPPAPSPGAHP